MNKEDYARLMEIRKSKRDALYVKHGDDWRKFEDKGNFWSAEMTPEESAQLARMKNPH